MKTNQITIVINGEEHDIELPFEIKIDIPEEENKRERKTGYERVEIGEQYYSTTGNHILQYHESEDDIDNRLYKNACYYSDYDLAVDNARAEKLIRQLRRFSIEHGSKKLNWDDGSQEKYYIDYNYDFGELECAVAVRVKMFGEVYFDTEQVAEFAIKEFHDELIWYFTEYKDSL